jgi:hypothetical protein
VDDIWEQTQINTSKEVLERGKTERGQTNQARIMASRHGDLFYRGSVPKNLIPVE